MEGAEVADDEDPPELSTEFLTKACAGKVSSTCIMQMGQAGVTALKH